MPASELTSQNYKRIWAINCLLCVPLMLIFGWPYGILAKMMSINTIILYVGALLFSFPFMVTILHGHAELALGAAHRHHYYNWLKKHPLTYGLFYHSVLISTRFRLILIGISAIAFIVGVFVNF